MQRAIASKTQLNSVQLSQTVQICMNLNLAASILRSGASVGDGHWR